MLEATLDVKRRHTQSYPNNKMNKRKEKVSAQVRRDVKLASLFAIQVDGKIWFCFDFLLKAVEGAILWKVFLEDDSKGNPGEKHLPRHLQEFLQYLPQDGQHLQNLIKSEIVIIKYKS